MENESTNWYFMEQNWRGMSVMRGPFTTSQIQAFLKTGEITGSTLIRYGNTTLWRPLRDRKTFAAMVRDAEAQRTRSAFWRKYGTGIIIVALIAGVVIYTKMQSTRYLFKAGNFVGNLLSSQEVLPSDNPVGNLSSRQVLNVEAIITLTNNARALNGLPPLRANLLLNTIAESRAKDMLEKQYFAHVSPTGQQASDIAQSVGYQYKIIAENIGSGVFYTNKKIVDGWMQSPGHRRNILSPEVEEIGAAALKGRMNGMETYISVQIFGLQSPPVSQRTCVAPSKSLLNDIELKKAEINSLNDQLQRMKQELNAEKESIETDRRYTYDNPQKIHSLNVKISAYNEKSRWYNRLVADTQGKAAVLESMVNTYNRMLQTYNDCSASN
jgi:uncharacterized protein YkwD